MSKVEQKSAELDRYGRRELARMYFRVILGLTVLLVSAGSFDWVNAWVYAGVNALIAIGVGRVLGRLNPQMFNARGRRPKDARLFDKIILALWIPTALSCLVVAGFDAVRYGRSAMPLWLNALGLLLYVGGVLFLFWAMAVNAYFEKTVRIQHDRDHQVCTKGPYRFVRHPGYSGLLVSSLAGPLVLGSWYALIPSAVVVVLFVIRTAIEDRMLRSELSGYADYARRTQYRLVPKVW